VELLSPDLTSLQDSSYDGSRHLEYSTFQTRFKELAQKVTERTGPFGTHSLRKSGYLLAVWGGGGMLEIMSSARHKTYSMAQKYMEDSSMLSQISKESHSSLDNIYPVFKSIFVKNIQMARRLNRMRSQKTLAEIVSDFMQAHFKEDEVLFQDLMHWIKVRPNLDDLEVQIASLLMERLSEQEYSAVTQLLLQWKSVLCYPQALPQETTQQHQVPLSLANQVPHSPAPELDMYRPDEPTILSTAAAAAAPPLVDAFQEDERERSVY
jgi:hypothetical protein